MTKVVTDENVKKIVSEYINHKFIAIRMTKLTYGKILKEGYFVNLDIGGIFNIDLEFRWYSYRCVR